MWKLTRIVDILVFAIVIVVLWVELFERWGHAGCFGGVRHNAGLAQCLMRFLMDDLEYLWSDLTIFPGASELMLIL